MPLSIFDVFKIGVGPSSSHTMGPMIAAYRFLEYLKFGDWPRPTGAEPVSVTARLHGSLAFTGKGHASDRAIILGLCGHAPHAIEADLAAASLAAVEHRHKVGTDTLGYYEFDPASQLIFDYDSPVGRHTNQMTFEAHDIGGRLLVKEIYYSTGGGFVVSEDDFDRAAATEDAGPELPHEFGSANELVKLAEQNNMTIADMVLANELARTPDKAAVLSQLDQLWVEMDGSIDRGLGAEGILPGGLNVKRRAGAIHKKLQEERQQNHINPLSATEWLTVYAMAVNEENAAGGRIVTAPTNGAAGVVPAAMKYYLEFHNGANRDGVRTFLLTAAAIGDIVKRNASISGAEVGCQGEVGSAAAMAAGGLTAALGGSPAQIENAAEIALEHHLGMTCDPVAGLVQVPCIERNGLGAVKAIAAAALSLRGDGTHVVSLDACIETMRQTGIDMDSKYKETSQGGLAVNAVEC
jgi:L-serine dehydratase